MLIDVVPTELQGQFDTFLQKLAALENHTVNACPHCGYNHFKQTRATPLTYRCVACRKYFNPLTNTAFNRLQPTTWFKVIFIGRVQRQSYQSLADELDCSVKMIMWRDQAILRDMQIDDPELLRWYQAHSDLSRRQTPQTLSDAITKQHQALQQKITDLLTTKEANCPYCDSANTRRISSRAGFRCRNCQRSFSLLANTLLHRLPWQDKWLAFIDLLVAQQNNRQIIHTLGLNHNTVSKWRRYWRAMMQAWGFAELAIWCK